MFVIFTFQCFTKGIYCLNEWWNVFAKYALLIHWPVFVGSRLKRYKGYENKINILDIIVELKTSTLCWCVCVCAWVGGWEFVFARAPFQICHLLYLYLVIIIFNLIEFVVTSKNLYMDYSCNLGWVLHRTISICILHFLISKKKKKALFKFGRRN